MHWNRLQILLGTLVLVGGFLLPPRVVAHPRLLASRPEAEGAVTGVVKRIELRFSERLEKKFHTVTITGEDGKSAKVNRLQLDSTNPTMLVVFCEPLSVGHYHVLWRVLSQDGHVGKGNFSFSIRR